MRIARIGLILCLALPLAGCAEMQEKVENAENPAPAGDYENVDFKGVSRINEKANYAWDIDGVRYDALANEDTEYYVNGSPVDYEDFGDAEDNEGSYEGSNEFSDDEYAIIVEPDGVIAAMNVDIGN